MLNTRLYHRFWALLKENIEALKENVAPNVSLTLIVEGYPTQGRDKFVTDALRGFRPGQIQPDLK